MGQFSISQRLGRHAHVEGTSLYYACTHLGPTHTDTHVYYARDELTRERKLLCREILERIGAEVNRAP